MADMQVGQRASSTSGGTVGAKHLHIFCHHFFFTGGRPPSSSANTTSLTLKRLKILKAALAPLPTPKDPELNRKGRRKSDARGDPTHARPSPDPQTTADAIHGFVTHTGRLTTYTSGTW